MRVIINGKEREIPENTNIPALIRLLNIKTPYLAIELNREIAKKSAWDNIFLKEGDKIEIVTFVGGG